jgi:streptogramin lyase
MMVNLSNSSRRKKGSFYTSLLFIVGLGFGIWFHGTVYADEMIDLGPQVYDLTLYKSAFGKDQKGRPVVYAPIVGNPSKLVIADLKSKKVLKVIPIPGAKGVWTVSISTDGKVWLGSYSNGHVYRYDPITEVLTDMGTTPTGSNVLYGLTPGKDGTMYGGSYGSAKIFAYNVAGQSYDLGSVFPDVYARDLAIDAKNHVLFAGVGAVRANVVRYDLKTGEKRPILPMEYQTDSFAYDLDFIKGKLFVKLEPSFRELVLNPSTGKPDMVTNGLTKEKQEYFPIGSRGVSSLAPDGKSVYFSYKYQLYRFDTTTNIYAPVPGASLANNVISWGWQEFNEPDYPGKTLVGMIGNYDGRAFRYNPVTGAHEEFTLPFPSQPLDLYHVIAGPDKKLYSSAYINGSLGIYDTETGKHNQFPGLGQVEGWTWYQDKLYVGTYPEGKILEYDPKQAWRIKENPMVLFSLKEQEQIRPMSLVVFNHKLFIGSRSEYGTWGGALTIYDLHKKGKPKVLRNIVPEQTITTIAAKNNRLWVGTSIEGGDATTPKANEAVLFEFDPETNKKVAEYSPLVRGTPLRISGLTVGPDGMLWGISDGILFQFDPVRKRAIRQTSLVRGGSATGTSMVFHPNGYLYVTVDGSLFKVDPKTWKRWRIPYKTNLYRLVQVGRDLYMKAGPKVNIGTNLVKYTPE